MAIRRAGDRVLVVGSAAAPVGGDALTLDVVVGPGARLSLGTVAATMAWPGPHGAWSHQARDGRRRRAAVTCAGRPSRWSPSPGAATARRRPCAWPPTPRRWIVEEVSLGRTGEASRSARARVAGRAGGPVLVHHAERLGPGVPGWGSAVEHRAPPPPRRRPVPSAWRRRSAVPPTSSAPTPPPPGCSRRRRLDGAGRRRRPPGRPGAMDAVADLGACPVSMSPRRSRPGRVAADSCAPRWRRGPGRHVSHGASPTSCRCTDGGDRGREDSMTTIHTEMDLGRRRRGLPRPAAPRHPRRPARRLGVGGGVRRHAAGPWPSATTSSCSAAPPDGAAPPAGAAGGGYGRPVRFGFKTAPMNTTWSAMLDVWREADQIECSRAAGTSTTSSRSSPTAPGRAWRAGRCWRRWPPHTSRLRLGCQVTGMPYRHPSVLANIAATVDVISDGRLIVGLGAGWNQEESRRPRHRRCPR